LTNKNGDLLNVTLPSDYFKTFIIDELIPLVMKDEFD